jgi:peptidoglycan/LPS O-acetylase OafA/YrhL
VNIKKKILSLEVLRFCAAILVVFHHYIGYQYGFIGVNIFFMISGFVIMYGTNENTRFFFFRRLIRIIPLYWFLTISFVTILIFFPDIISKSYYDFIFLIKSLFFIPFENLGIGPGIGHSPYIFLGWTLNYEVYFYFIFQLAIFISHKYRGIILIILFMIIHFLINKLNFDNFILKTYSDPIIFQFCYGIVIYYLWSHNQNKNKLDNLYFPILLILIFFVFYDLKHMLELENNIRLYYSLISQIIMFVFIFLLEKIFRNNYFLVFGAISYPIYLVHPYIKIVMDKNLFLIKYFDTSFYYIFLLVINLIIAWFLYNFFEKKIIKNLNSRLNKK